jgi:hypothetical protein
VGGESTPGGCRGCRGTSITARSGPGWRGSNAILSIEASVGVLLAATADASEYQARLGSFQQELQKFGWSIGRNLRVDIRWAGIHADDIRRHAAELVALAPDVILATSTQAVVDPVSESEFL